MIVSKTLAAKESTARPSFVVVFGYLKDITSYMIEPNGKSSQRLKCISAQRTPHENQLANGFLLSERRRRI